MNIAAWLTDTINVASLTGVTTHGDATYGAPVAVLARWEPISRLVRDARGDEVIADTRIITTTQINPTDRIWVPGTSTANAWQGRTPISVRSSKTKGGSLTVWEILL